MPAMGGKRPLPTGCRATGERRGKQLNSAIFRRAASATNFQEAGPSCSHPNQDTSRTALRVVAFVNGEAVCLPLNAIDVEILDGGFTANEFRVDRETEAFSACWSLSCGDRNASGDWQD